MSWDQPSLTILRGTSNTEYCIEIFSSHVFKRPGVPLLKFICLCGEIQLPVQLKFLYGI